MRAAPLILLAVREVLGTEWHAKCSVNGDCDQQGSFCSHSKHICVANTPPGHYAPPSHVGFSACPAGSAAPHANSLECTACEPGRYEEEEGQTECECVPEGYVANSQRTAISKCPRGRANTRGCNEDECQLCEAGKYAPDEGMHACVDVSAGFYASDDRTEEVECPPGTFSSQQGSECMACEAGRYTGALATLECTCAPAGHRPNENATSEEPCGPGFYQDEECQADCEACPAGKYIGSAAAHACQDASVGHQPSDDNTTEVPCKAGTYQDERGQASCKTCAAGKFIGTTGSSDECTCSSAGHEPSADFTKQVPCKPGTYQDKACSGPCKACEAGKFTDQPGSFGCAASPAGHVPNKDGSDVVPCAPGTYQNDTGKSACDVCPAGKFTEAEGSRGCRCASEGHSPSKDHDSEVECEPGTFQNETCQEKCHACFAGMFSRTSGAQACECVPVGHEPEKNGNGLSIGETPCSPGTFQSDACQAECEECPAGTFSSAEGAHECVCASPGHAVADDKATEVACDPGTYQDETCQAECKHCASGKFANTTGSHRCMDVAPGFILKSPGDGEVACGPGTYATEGLPAEDKTCEPCPPGRFTESSASTTCEYCPEGMHVSQAGQTACRKCAMPDMWDELEGNDDYDECMACSFWQHGNEDGPVSTVCTSCFASAKVMVSSSNCGVLAMLLMTLLFCSVSGVLVMAREALRTKESSHSKYVDAQKLLENSEDPEIADPREVKLRTKNSEEEPEVADPQGTTREVAREGTQDSWAFLEQSPGQGR